ncbi:MAG: hypothetical protein KJ930_06835 [Gammaproteobacteria bacterium]|nr:hypothetical protein [Gammaproteobacteria bacterium]MBU2179136.1 hypothetical protein [Gammaproteobacteria bacterium]MBU2224550.1 hypothetical protein [Gammaproteobacteria bacterium]MBU2425756.1 hypothetical protein [Gammaproteobacteria bacterium]
MNHVKLFTLVTLLLVAVVSTQSAVALQAANQPTAIYISSAAAVQPEEDDHEEPDVGGECPYFVFPYCEAHVD